MTLQQIADYAMEYLDSKGVAAEYHIFKYSDSVGVLTDSRLILLSRCDITEIESKLQICLLDTQFNTTQKITYNKPY